MIARARRWRAARSCRSPASSRWSSRKWAGDDGRYVYEVEAVAPNGRLVEISIDAATGAILDRDYEDD